MRCRTRDVGSCASIADFAPSHSFRKQFAKFLEDDIGSEDIEDMYRCVSSELS